MYKSVMLLALCALTCVVGFSGRPAGLASSGRSLRRRPHFSYSRSDHARSGRGAAAAGRHKQGLAAGLDDDEESSWTRGLPLAVLVSAASFAVVVCGLALPAGAAEGASDALNFGVTIAEDVVSKLGAPDLGQPGSSTGFSHDALVFLAATVVVTPLCRILNTSPILGYLIAGAVLGPVGFDSFRDFKVDEELAEIGILFLLFEQGLELTLERLEKLKVYAFGLGTIQFLLCSLIFGVFPFIGGVELLTNLVGSKPELVSITRPDEAIVIGCALSLSSSAFVLRLLQEKKQSNETFALACLGVLLLQDVAVVPLLVLLPLIESTQVLGFEADVGGLATSAASSLAILGAILFGGRLILRRVFAAVAGANSSETFIALCLLVVVGTGALTDSVGLSSTLGAFIAGVLLAETNYRAQIEADIQPFRGLLLGLFFMTTGAAVDPSILVSEAPTAISLLVGLLAVKVVVVSSFGHFAFKLTRGDALRTGLLLAGGGEFAFVVLTLATRLNVLPESLAKLDTALVVVSMALTPALGALGDYLGAKLDATEQDAQGISPQKREEKLLQDSVNLMMKQQELLENPSFANDDEFYTEADEFYTLKPQADVPVVVKSGPRMRVVIGGFGPTGQTVAALLEKVGDLDYVVFENKVPRVAEAAARGLPVAYGGPLTPILVASVVKDPETLAALVLPVASVDELSRIRAAFDGVPVLATTCTSFDDRASLPEPGRTDHIVDAELELGLKLGAEVLARHSDVSSAEIKAAVDSLRMDVTRRTDAMRNILGRPLTTVSGGGIDIDTGAVGGIVAGARAIAARDLIIYAGVLEKGSLKEPQPSGA